MKLFFNGMRGTHKRRSNARTKIRLLTDCLQNPLDRFFLKITATTMNPFTEKLLRNLNTLEPSKK